MLFSEPPLRRRVNSFFLEFVESLSDVRGPVNSFSHTFSTLYVGVFSFLRSVPVRKDNMDAIEQLPGRCLR